MGKQLLRVALAALLAASSGWAAAANCSSTSGGNWNAAIWSCSPTVPGAADNVTINAGHNVNLNAVNRNSQNLTIAGTLTLGGNSITINNNGVVQINGLLQGNGTAGSLFTKNGTGGLSGTGTVNNVTVFLIVNATTVAGGTNLTFTGANCR